MALRWEKEASPEAATAYSGDAIIGSIVHQSVGERLWVYTVTGVNVKWVAKGHGFVKSRASARRAVERAWATWLEHAALNAP